METLVLYNKSLSPVKPTVIQLPSSRTATKATLIVKANMTDADADALLSVSITTSAAAQGQIVDTGAGGTATLTFIVQSTDFGNLPVAEQAYYYGIKVILDDGSYYDDQDSGLNAWGLVTVRPSPVQATT